ncbi:DUF930 domain-containing protein [Oryzifoliimicrobium ureilyticus]|uniref:DUF930 domain-containing protein n=1 Tax=Oryzifoliimicrobium ureilyticus TaxID=3113724 RepID=UPI003076142D
MTTDPKTGGKVTGWGLAAAVVLHLALLPFLFAPMPGLSSNSADETVDISLVPPPEEEKAKEEKPPEPEEKPEEKKPEEKKPEEKRPQEKEPDRPLPPAETAGGQKPQPEKAERAEQAAPKPEPEKSEEPAKSPPPKEEEKADKPEAPPPSAEDAAKRSESANAQSERAPGAPVAEFGEKDTGPEKSLEGSISSSLKGPHTPSDEAQEPQSQAGGEEAKKEVTEPQSSTSTPLPPDVDLPKVDAPDTLASLEGPDALRADSQTRLPDVAPRPLPKPEMSPASNAGGGGDMQTVTLTPVSKIYSRAATGDPRVRTAIGKLPPQQRLIILCSNELTAHLIRLTGGRKVDSVPKYETTDAAIILDKPDAAYLAVDGKWYHLSFRCQVDQDSMRVDSFAFKVGAQVAASERAKYGIKDD